MTTRGGLVRREWAIALLALVVVTAGLIAVRDVLDKTHIALAYLVVVLVASSRGGRAVGIATSVAAFLCFNLFFVLPYHRLTVSDPRDWVVLAAFLLTSVVAAQLLVRARTEASAAELRAKEVERLSILGDVKNAVLASVSHDLRTPLTTIKGLAHEIRRDGDDRAAIIEEEADRLNRFVADLLDLSRLAAGGVRATPEVNAAEDLVGAALQRTSGAVGDRTIVAALVTTEPLLLGRFDFVHSLRVLGNLIENAIKYSPPGSTIEVQARRAGSRLEFLVADRGPGISPADQESMFEPFSRRESSVSDAGGAGLGLSIARGLAEAQGGTLRYEAREGGGSTFVFSVPAADVAELDDASL